MHDGLFRPRPRPISVLLALVLAALLPGCEPDDDDSAFDDDDSASDDDDSVLDDDDSASDDDDSAFDDDDSALDDDDSAHDDDDSAPPPDADGDGWTADVDCDDTDPGLGAPRIGVLDSNVDAVLTHLAEVMDATHERYDVYSDLSAPGNHFVALGRMSSAGDGALVDTVPGSTSVPCYSGCDCVEAVLVDGGGPNWGGWYFMNGVLGPTDVMPGLNWGDVPDAGILDLAGATEASFCIRGAVGGEVVEVFSLGVGRDPATGQALTPHPDSGPRVDPVPPLGPLTTSWTCHAIDLAAANTSYVLGALGWAANVVQNPGGATFYLDDISFDVDRTTEPRLLASYVTECSTEDFDTVLRNVAFTYDNALAALAFLAAWTESGDPEWLDRASLVGEALVYAFENDRTYRDADAAAPSDDRRLRNGYQAGDLALWPGWNPNGHQETARMAGWWSEGAVTWYEDEFQVSSHTGNQAWPMLALLALHDATLDPAWLDAAVDIAWFVEDHTRQSAGYGGYSGGYEGWEGAETAVSWKSTEHNLDLYTAFSRLHLATGDAIWNDAAAHARAFVEAMWQPGLPPDPGRFLTGTAVDEATGIEQLNTTVIPADASSWAVLALGAGYAEGLDWVEQNLAASSGGLSGFSYSDADTSEVWFEGTAHMALAWAVSGDLCAAETWLSEIESALYPGPDSAGLGVPAASGELQTGFAWSYYDRLHIGAGAFYVLGRLGWNPFWNIPYDDPIP